MVTDTESNLYLIDFLNIAYYFGKAELATYLLVQKAVQSIDPSAEIITVADPHAYRVIDDKQGFKALKKSRELIQVGPSEKADFYLIQYAKDKPHCFIITNDAFRDYEINDGLKDRLIRFTIIKDEVIFSENLNKALKS